MNTSFSSKTQPQQHSMESSSTEKDDDSTNQQLFRSALLGSSQLLEPRVVYTPTPLAEELRNPPMTTPPRRGASPRSSPLDTALSVPPAMDQRESHIEAISISPSLGHLARSAHSSLSSQSAFEARQSTAPLDISTFPASESPMQRSQNNLVHTAGTGETLAGVKANAPPMQTPFSSSHSTASSLLTRKLPPLPPPPSTSEALVIPELALPQTATLTVEQPSHAPSLRVYSHSSVVAGVSLADAPASPDPNSLSYAVTSLLPPSSEPPPVALTSPQPALTECVKTASLASSVVMSNVVETRRSPVVKRRRQQPFRRRRGEWEATVVELFSTGSASDDALSSSSSVSSVRGGSERGSVEEGSARDRRSRQVGCNPAERNRRRRSSGSGVGARGRKTSSHKPSKLKSTRDASRSKRKRTVVRLHEAEGRCDRSPPPASGAMARPSLNSRDVRANDIANQKAGKSVNIGHRIGNSAKPADVVDGDGAVQTAPRGRASVSLLGDSSGVPLLFTDPAAALRLRYISSTKNKGFTEAEANWLIYVHSLGQGSTGRRQKRTKWSSGATTSFSVGGTESGAGDWRRTPCYRVTGAFNDDNAAKQTWTPGSLDTCGDPETVGFLSANPSPLAAGGGRDECGVVLALTIRGMSPLHADAAVVHPFVRVWLVSGVSGRSLLEASAAVPCAVTHPFDLRAHQSRVPWWNAQLALRISSEKLGTATKDAMLLLEVLDFGNESIHGYPLFREGLYPICWGFLMLRDCAGRSNLFGAEELHLQLYRYPSRTPWYLSWLSMMLPVPWSSRGAALNLRDLAVTCGYPPSSCDDSDDSFAHDVPLIYTVFKNPNNRKIPYDGGLVVSLREMNNVAFVPDTTEMLAYEEYLLSMLVAGGGSSAVPRSTRAVGAPADYFTEMRQGTKDSGLGDASVPPSPWSTQAPTEHYYRMDGERSLLPQEILQTTSILGVVTCVTFSHRGTLIALGVSRHLQHVVELRDPFRPDIPPVVSLAGHTGHIHRVVFQKEDRYLLSCSSDGTVSVWQCIALSEMGNDGARPVPETIQHVCTLPHGFPVYVAVFHQNKIIAGGFSDQLLVWGYEHTSSSEATSVGASEDTALRLSTALTPDFVRAAHNGDFGSSPPKGIGELVHRVDAIGATIGQKGETSITLSLASNERSTRVWSVHHNGSVVCWRATEESASGSDGKEGRWGMSVRHIAECDGATEVQVKGAYALVTCGRAPFVFVFNASTSEQLRVVNTRLPFATPIHLLPDGEAFVAAVGDPGRLLAWECFDGSLCTQATGYAKVSPLFSIAKMAWAESQQLAIFVSRSPCSEKEMVRYTQGPMSAPVGQSSAAFHYRQQELQYRQKDMPTEKTLISLAGTVRSKSTVIITTEPHSSLEFVQMFGGDVEMKRRTAYLAKRMHSIHQNAAERESRNARLYPSATTPEPLAVFVPAAATSIPYEATGKGSRINSILNFWRGLVTQHRHAEAHRDLVEEASSRGDNSARQPSTWRALQYTENEAEV